MTAPESPTDVALQYVREALSTLRASVHDELSAMRTDITNLATEMRGHTAAIGPQIAVILHRLGEHDKDIAEVKQSKRDSRAAWAAWVAIAVAAVASIAAVIALLK